MNKWISVENRLPEHSDNYLIWMEDHSKQFAFPPAHYHDIYYYSMINERFKLDHDGQQIKYWMPLPEPPE